MQKLKSKKDQNVKKYGHLLIRVFLLDVLFAFSCNIYFVDVACLHSDMNCVHIDKACIAFALPLEI